MAVAYLLPFPVVREPAVHGYYVSAVRGCQNAPSGQMAAQPFLTQLAQGKMREHLERRSKVGYVTDYDKHGP